MSFYFTVFVSKERKITHQKDPFLEFLIFLVGRVHAKLISLESNSAILLRHNQIYSVILLRHRLFMLTFLFLIVTGFKRFRESGRKRHKGKIFFSVYSSPCISLFLTDVDGDIRMQLFACLVNHYSCLV